MARKFHHRQEEIACLAPFGVSRAAFGVEKDDVLSKREIF